MMTFKIDRPDEEVRKQVKQRIDAIAKPLDSLGRFENYIAQIGAILGTCEIDLRKKAVLAMCADNGIVEEGISQSGQEVTAIVAASMGKGASSVCKMAKVIGADVIPVDVGINGTDKIPGVLAKKVMCGTHNFLKEPAMSKEQALAAIEVGMELVRDCKEQGYRILATGEMGIGNTTTSAVLAAAMIGCPVEAITGRGAGLSDAGLARKRDVVRLALEKYPEREDVLEVLSCVGGLDIAAMAGVFLGGAKYHVPIVIDGVISAVAALVAERLKPGVKAYMLPSHKSKEPAANLLLQELRLEPVLDAGLALGEGTGAVMFLGLLDMAMALYHTPTTFGDIEMEQYTRF